MLKHDELTTAPASSKSYSTPHPDDPASNILLADLAIKSFGESAYPSAQKYYEKALAAEPTRIDAAMPLLATIYVSQNRTLDAAKVLRRTARGRTAETRRCIFIMPTCAAMSNPRRL